MMASQATALRESSRAAVELFRNSLNQQHEAFNQAFYVVSRVKFGFKAEEPWKEGKARELWKEAELLESSAATGIAQAIKRASEAQAALEEKLEVDIPDCLRADSGWDMFTTPVILNKGEGPI